MEKQKRFLVLWSLCSFIAIVLLAVFLDAELHLNIILGLFAGSWLSIVLYHLLYGLPPSKEQGRTSAKTVAPRATTPRPVYIRRPFENGFTYRIEWQHGKQYVFEGRSNRFVYRIEGDKVYRGLEAKVCYQIKGNKVYRNFDYKDPVYRIEGEKIYQGNFGTRPVYIISNRALR